MGTTISLMTAGGYVIGAGVIAGVRAGGVRVCGGVGAGVGALVTGGGVGVAGLETAKELIKKGKKKKKLKC